MKRYLLIVLLFPLMVGCNETQDAGLNVYKESPLYIRCSTDDSNQADAWIYCHTFDMTQEGEYVTAIAYDKEGKKCGMIIGKLPHQVISARHNPSYRIVKEKP